MSTEQVEISLLRYPDNVRKRKEMYLTDKNHAVFEIVDNAVDEFAAGYCTAIAVAIVDGKVIVEDNGRGININPHKDPEFKGLSQAEVAFTTLHAGGKFGDSGANSYKTATGGLHGVGSACVNAVSSNMELYVYNGGKKYEVKFEKGIITQNLTAIEEGHGDKTGTEVHFVLDDEVWEDEKFDLKKIQKRIRQLAYLNPGLLIYLYIDSEDKDGKRVKIEEQYHYEDGLKSYMERLLKGKSPLSDVMYHTTNIDDIEIHLSFAYTDGYNQDIYTFVNNIATENGGDHLIGFQHGLAKTIEKYALENDFIKNSSDIEAADTREGLIAIVSVKVKEPKFEGQGKSRIRMGNVRTAVRKATEEYLLDYLNQNPDEAKTIINKTLTAAKARKAAKKARDAARVQKEIVDAQGLPGKLADCSSKKPEECEIFLVEGEI